MNWFSKSDCSYLFILLYFISCFARMLYVNLVVILCTEYIFITGTCAFSQTPNYLVFLFLFLSSI